MTKLLVSFGLLAIVLIGTEISLGQRKECFVKEVKFARGTSSTLLKGQLKPCRSRIYKLRARAGQRMNVRLEPDFNDLVFHVQGTKFLPAPVYSFALAGIHKNGETEWSGTLPNDDLYEIWISHPEVTNKRLKRTVPYRLIVEIYD